MSLLRDIDVLADLIEQNVRLRNALAEMLQDRGPCLSPSASGENILLSNAVGIASGDGAEQGDSDC